MNIRSPRPGPCRPRRRPVPALLLLLAVPAVLGAQSDVAGAAPSVTPSRGSAERTAILDAVRRATGVRSRFEVDHLKVSGRWAYVRCGEVVIAEGALEETDLSVAALLERATVKGRSGWRVVELWTLPSETERPWKAYASRVRERQRVGRIPADLFDGPLGDVP